MHSCYVSIKNHYRQPLKAPSKKGGKARKLWNHCLLHQFQPQKYRALLEAWATILFIKPSRVCWLNLRVCSEYLYFSLNYTVSKFSIYLHIRFDLNLSSVSPLDLSSITLHEQSIELGQQISLQTCAFLKVSLVVWSDYPICTFRITRLRNSLYP